MTNLSLNKLKYKVNNQWVYVRIAVLSKKFQVKRKLNKFVIKKKRLI